MRKLSSPISLAQSCLFRSNTHSFSLGAVSASTSSGTITSRIFLPPGSTFLSPKRHYCVLSSSPNPISATSPRYFSKENEDGLEVEIISKENIKPAIPTPHHLTNYEVSILDQLLPKNIYMPFVYFYPSNKTSTVSKRKLLKQSLSETLIKFYPLAGKVQDDRNIVCNDEGVYYVEAKANQNFSRFLNKPDKKSIHQLLPFDPSSVELLSQTFVVMIQVTEFDCGGIVFGIYTSHKIMDGYSITTFLKAWGNSARGFTEEICPNFTSPSIFLPIPTFPDVSTTATAMEIFPEQSKCLTRRFVFSASALRNLKKEAGTESTRVRAVIGLIWKCAIAASKKVKSFIILLPVNLRARSSPRLPEYSIGNLIWCAVAQWERGDNAELNSILKNATDKIDSGFIEKLKGEEGSRNIGEMLKEINSCYNKDGEFMAVTSLCNGGFYEVDFGWGKPIWVSKGNADADSPLVTNEIMLMDTRYGDGIEAWVTLNQQNMVILEQDEELLQFASVNPSPIEKLP